jgi:amino acid adenylation domain-containing protein
MSKAHAVSLGDSFRKVVGIIISEPSCKLENVCILSAADLVHLDNQQPLTTEESSCTHRLIGDQARSRPDAEAVAAWDYSFSYAELESLTTTLAVKLRQLGAGPDEFVLVCFPKSAWAVVAMVAVQKAGAAFVPLDPGGPPQRLQRVVAETKARYALSARSNRALIQELGIDPVVVDEDALRGLSPGQLPKQTASPNHASFAVFTSGSTGNPKGIVMEHRAVCATAKAYGSSLGIGSGSRVFQFAAYTFDMGILDILVTLMRGGCVCVPSDHDRVNNLPRAINAAGANFLSLTPTVGEFLSPADVPQVEVVCFAGEVPNQTTIDRWKSKVQLHGIYGPAEASTCAWNPNLGQGEKPKPNNIGRPISSTFWVIHPSRPLEPVPIGCVGELLVAGPMLARGYLEESADHGRWLSLGGLGGTRVYRTGDLVRQHLDGSFDFIGRKDSQIKIRGQRVELAEIESHLSRLLPESTTAIVDMVETVDGGLSALTAMIWFYEGYVPGTSSVQLEHPPEILQRALSDLEPSLRAHLPSHMIPSRVLVFGGLPERTTSGKVDRRACIALGNSMANSKPALVAINEEPTTAMEVLLRQLWASSLHLPLDHIGRASNFFYLGGDSLAAMRLAAAASTRGLALDTATVLRHPKLEDMAKEANFGHGLPAQPGDPAERFSLLPATIARSLEEAARDLCGLSAEQIEDAYPSTALQEGLLALSVKQPGSFIARLCYKGNRDVDIGRFKEAWRRTVSLCSNIRTRIVFVQGKSVQVIAKDDAVTDECCDVDMDVAQADVMDAKMTYGSPLSCVRFAKDSEGRLILLWAIHHSVFDGWSLRSILSILNRLYYGSAVKNPPPFSRFIHYTTTLDRDSAADYWKAELSGAERAPLPVATTGTPDAASRATTRTLDESLSISPRDYSVTKASILRAAWALVLAAHGGIDDVCFGATVSGRQAPVSDVEELIGPTIATVPVRVRLNREQTVSQYLQDVQSQAVDMIAHEQFGLQNIARLGPDAGAACDFSSLLVIQPSNESSETVSPALLRSSGLEWLSSSGMDSDEAPQGYLNYPLVVRASGEDRSIGFRFFYDSALIPTSEIQRLSRLLCHVVRLLLDTPEQACVGSLMLASPWDIQKAEEWSGADADVVYACVHDLVSKRASRDGERLAIVSWDGTLTFADLEGLSDRFARHLNTIGVLPGTFVLVCFEKSMWAIVAILGILKAGGAFVPVNPLDLAGRRRQLADAVGAHFAVVSSSVAASWGSQEGLVTVELSSSLLSTLGPTRTDMPRSLSSRPDGAAYIITTSGSTGQPKSIIVDHSALCSSLKAQSITLGLNMQVRLLQYANYVFDVAMAEIFLPLILGGVVCVPSDTQRLDIARFVQEVRVNTAMLTPSLAATLSPQDVTSLETLVLCGEAPSRYHIDTWRDQVRLLNGYGPSETVVFCTFHAYHSGDSPTTIGRPLNGRCWIVDPVNRQQLAPIGCVGELVVQGPVLARGYVDTEATRQSFIDGIAWNESNRLSCVEKTVKLYRTGDLVRYNPDGTIEYMGRMDAQIKLRGQRVEPGEVEHGIKKVGPGIEHAAVVVARRDTSDMLIAFLSFFGAQIGERGKVQAQRVVDTMEKSLVALAADLEAVLPGYMVPSYFIPLQSMPLVASMKIDRKKLQDFANDLTTEDLAYFSLKRRRSTRPPTSAEAEMRDVWVQVLGAGAATADPEDEFMRLGGDSIAVIRLVTALRDRGINIEAGDVFRDSRLSTMAVAANSTGADVEIIEPFSLLKRPIVDAIPGVHQPVVDAYPCTALQEGLLALATKQPGSYVARFLYRLRDDVNLELFHGAWDRLVSAFDNLRTRIVLVDDVPTQVVLASEDSWSLGRDVQRGKPTYFLDQQLDVGYGSSLSRQVLVFDDKGRTWLVWHIHHAVYDGWTMNMSVDALDRFYHGQDLHVEPYNRFVKYATTLDLRTTSEYWRSLLSGASRASYPPDPVRRRGPGIDTTETFMHSLPSLDTANLEVTLATVLRTAWAIVLGRYSDTDDVTFGVTVSGRQAPVAGVSRMAGPTVATVPVRVRLNRSEPLSTLLSQVQSQALEMVPHEQFGLQNISGISHDASDVCDFSSLLVVQPSALIGGHAAPTRPILHNHSEQWQSAEVWQGYFNYPLVIQAVIMDDTSIQLLFIYNSNVLSESEIAGLARHLDHVIRQLAAADCPLSSVSLTSDWDLKKAVEWSGDDAETLSTYTHDLISAQTDLDGSRQAVFAWDGTLTYAELDRLSSRLAGHLFAVGVNPYKVVAICMEKTLWAIVAVLGIFKAGGAFVFLSPSDPPDRRRSLLKRAGAGHMIVSATTASLCRSLSIHVIELSASTNLPAQPRPNIVAGLDRTAYIVYTSGSTGEPKGVVVDHFALASALTAQGRALALDRPRFLQFSNFIFDGSLVEMLATLVLGGTVCMPSDAQRLQDIAGFMREARVNTALLTPSFAATLRPRDVPDLQTLLIGGEAPLKDNLETWFGHVRLFNVYGPSEGVIMCASYHYAAVDRPTTIGRPHQGRLWVVEPDDHHRLAPIGCVGELVVQGPVLARGYLEETVNRPFVEANSFGFGDRLQTPVRMYKTGDLVRFNPDGTICYMGRIDSQVKLRGQRIELEEIEYSVRAVLPDVEHAAVDIAHHESGDMLVAFVALAHVDGGKPIGAPVGGIDDTVLSMNETLRGRFVALADGLKRLLAPHMLPNLFLPLRSMPFTATGKLDRKILRRIADGLPRERYLEYSLDGDGEDEGGPLTPAEYMLRGLWAEVLAISPEQIGRNGKFLHIGGDSITAIRLISAARRQGFFLEMSDIFMDSRLSALATKLQPLDVDGTDHPMHTAPPFSLVTGAIREAVLRGDCQGVEELPDQYHVEDIYPCTPLQEGLMALTQAQPGTYVTRFVYRLSPEVDVRRFRDAWEQTVQLSSMLRTSIVVVRGRSVQAVLSGKAPWESTEEGPGMALESYLHTSRVIKMSYGSRLSRQALVRDGSVTYFVWTAHHATFDGWAVGLVLSILHASYHDHRPPPITPYSLFLKYIASLDDNAAKEYWQTELDGAERAHFPPAVSYPASRDEQSVATLTANIRIARAAHDGITLASVIRAAWAIVLARYCDSDDVCFGTTVSGRHAPVRGLEAMPGPALATIPVRVRLDRQCPVSQFLSDIQNHASDMVAFEQFGLQNISKISPEIKQACEFSSLLVIQPAQQMGFADGTTRSIMTPVDQSEEAMQNFFTYPLVVQAHMIDDCVELHLFYKTNMLREPQMQALAEQLDHTIQQLLTQDDTPLSSLSIASPWDHKRSLTLNAHDPAVCEATIHQLIEAQVQSDPNAVAIRAWDGNFTYAEYDRAANRLAHLLHAEYRIQTDELVLVCFEKSAWYLVAILAINKAGGAWVPLDASHPDQRQQQIVSQTRARLALTSSSNTHICKNLVANVVEVTSSLLDDLTLSNPNGGKYGPTTTVSASNAAYVLFTSGSTGTPKGLVMEHRSVCTSQTAIADRLGLTSDIRILQFASFVFRCISRRDRGPFDPWSLRVYAIRRYEVE